jgi:hypothetical protein
MFSARTNNELAFVIQDMDKATIERMLKVFSFHAHLTSPLPSNSRMANVFLDYLQIPNRPGPFSNSFSLDTLQYVLDNFYRGKSPASTSSSIFGDPTPFEDLFSTKYHLLANSLKRDGFVVKGTEIRKALPEEIEEAQTETELFKLLDKLSFSQSKSHLQQGIDNHSSSQWAAANGQFRTFIESLLMEICSKLSGTSCGSAAYAITSLSNLTPPFLTDALNEVKSATNGIDVGFVNGLWKRLHPQGSHPGISDEEDCTFRYHITIVFAHYLMKRLTKRLGVAV